MINTLSADRSNFSSGRSGKIRYIVVHYTGNKGDTARANCVYYSGADRKASAHYFVDETEVWQSVADGDTAWHCGTATGKYYHPECRNQNSIGVEMCSDWANGEYVITAATQTRAAELILSLMDKYGIAADHVVRHYDVTHKLCPRPFVEHPEQWTEFLAMLSRGGGRALSAEGDEDMTQEQFDSMMDKYIEERSAKDVSDYAREAWEKATAAGTVNGRAPRGFLTREQFVTVLNRLGIGG